MTYDDNQYNQDALMRQLQVGPNASPYASFGAPGIAPTEGRGPLQEADTGAPVAAPAPKANTRLMEGDAGKLADPGHAMKSPKYAFLQLANQNKYGYDQLGDMLGELQKSSPDFYSGWSADKDKLRYTGDPSKLHGAWNGVTEVDAIGAYNSGKPTGWRWGADEAKNQAAAGQMRAPAAMTMGGLSPMLQADPAADIQQALASFAGKSPNIQALLAQLAQG